MPDNVIPFSNEEPEDDYCCDSCDLTMEFMSYVLEAESDGEVYEVLRALVDESKKLGIKEYLIHEISSKMNLIDHLELGCDCEEE